MIRVLVRDYEHIHTSLGILGNLLFVIGSVLFYKNFDQYYALAVTLFVVGSALMFVGALGEGLRRMYERQEKRVST